MTEKSAKDKMAEEVRKCQQEYQPLKNSLDKAKDKVLAAEGLSKKKVCKDLDQ